MRDEQLLPGNIERIGVFRAMHLGGVLCSTPALRALRAAFPSAQITLIGLPCASDLVRRLSDVDQLLPFPGFPGMPECDAQVAALPDFFRAAQASRRMPRPNQNCHRLSESLTRQFAWSTE